MKVLRLVLGDQVSESLSSLKGCDKKNDTILMAEVKEEATYVKHHKKKIAFLFSAMRHFAKQLEDKQFTVEYIDYNHANNKGSLFEQVKRSITSGSFDKLVVTEPGEYRLLDDMKQWQSRLDIKVDILEDTRFIVGKSFFSEWAKDRKQLRMEYFYRELRKKTNYLMDGKKPIGGEWNYDSQNRQTLPAEITIPKQTKSPQDEITQEVLKLVESEFSDHFGDLEPFHFAVTRNQALQVLKQFISERLEKFGDYQDAMAEKQPWLFHSHIGFYLNCGLLLPDEVIEAAESAYHSGEAPLNSVEGFIRQILGWREYVRGFYWHFMPELKQQNSLNATRALPDFFWSSHTNMNCLRQCIKETKENAYAHHIQRLMVIGNFALLAGLSVEEVNEWYLLVYADAYEWVELPNVSAMILFADGGKLASKPYAASGSYINKMSDYCKNCGYSVTKKSGEKACPFNYLYWDFVTRNKPKLENNPRMKLVLNSLNRMSDEKVEDMQQSAQMFLEKLDNAQEV
jgi:deoxyribodipyrimidine photolyase-related protein